MEDEIDIYADLPNFNLGDNENLAENNKKISEKCTRLEKQVADLTQSLESLQKVNYNLEVNLSSLLKTAKAEIARKDRMIADIRQQLDNMKFRRGEYSRSVRQTRRSPLRRKREYSPQEGNDVVEVPEVPDTTEFVCNPPPSIKEDDNGTKKSRRVNGAASTVFGERLRKRILEEQEEERKQKEQSRARAEMDSKGTTESKIPEEVHDSNAQTFSRANGLPDTKPDSVVRLRNKESSLGSSSSLNSQEDSGLAKRYHPDRKRQLEDQAEPAFSHKKLRSNDGKSRHRDQSRLNDGGTHNYKNSSKSKTSEDLFEYQIVDEYQAPVENDLQNKGGSFDTMDDNENQDRHNRVAIRLMLLAEGIDPDIETKKSAQSGQKKAVEDKRQSSKKSRETSRSRSKSRNRRHDRKSRSRTPDEHWKNRRGNRQHEDRRRRSRDRFDRRRESKNKDGDNLSEFSREICELKERIEHRVDDRSVERAAKGRSLNRHRRNDERSCKTGRSRTPDSSRSDSKERTELRSKVDEQRGRSWSRERHKSRSRGKRQSNFDDVSTKNSRAVVAKQKKTEDAETVPIKATENPETKSLLSLEDGEIVDSAISSPVQIPDSGQRSTENNLPASCKLNLLDSDGLAFKIADLRCSVPLKETGNQNNAESVLLEKPALCILESNQCLNDSLNTSKDERIENIAEFIANFSSNVSERKKTEKSNDELIDDDIDDALQTPDIVVEEKAPKEKIQFILNTVFQGSSKEPLVSPLKETSDAVCEKEVNRHNIDEDWCLIAIDSPIKNFEENRKNRMMAQNLQNTEKIEPPKIEHPNDSETTCVDDSHKKIDSEQATAVSDKTTKPLSQPIKSNSKTKPAVLTSLRSTYRKSRKEIVLSDTNSEQCTKISMTNSLNSTNESLGYESETKQQNREAVDESVKSTSIESKNLLLEDVDRNCNKSQKNKEKPSVEDLFGDENDSGNTADDQSDVVSAKNDHLATVNGCVGEITKKNVKSKGNNKVEKEPAPKIGCGLKSEPRNSVAKESKSKQTTACKTDLSTSTETDATQSIGSKSKTGCRAEKTEENEESSIRKSLENGIKPAKSVSKAKVEGSNSKQKKEPQKLTVITRRRKPVHLEDSSTLSSVVMNPNSVGEVVDNSSKSRNEDTEPSTSLDIDREISTEHGENQAKKTTANNEKDSIDVEESEFSNVKEKRTV